MKKTVLSLLLILLLVPGSLFSQDVINRGSPWSIANGDHSSFLNATIKFGRNSDVDTGTDPEDIWNTGGTFTPFPDDSTCEIVSASASDASAGTGARTVTVFGVDSSFVRISETVTLNGQTEVDLTLSYRVIYRALVATAGSGLTNAGAVTIQTKTNNVAMLTMAADCGQSESTIFPIAADETGFVYDWYVCTGTAAADVVASLYAFNVSGNVWNLKSRVHSRVTGNTFVGNDWSQLPLKVDGSAILKITVTTDTDDTDVTGGFTVLYFND